MRRFDEIGQLTSTQGPRLFLIVDYNTGKTSFIKRLFVDGGLQIPKRLTVRADATTSEVGVYEWEGLTLVDSPGLRSGRVSDNEARLS